MGHGFSTAGWPHTCSVEASQLLAKQALTQLRHVGQSAGKCTTLRRVCNGCKQPWIGSHLPVIYSAAQITHMHQPFLVAQESTRPRGSTAIAVLLR